ncbi:hypothetical protein DUNSADRAFT_3247 [Dunaliella salina]|uniref:Uncharacterized protein n=1 Tax=Dunaliella salina TaxID=3046 RepID=A0ABQ7GUF3_DUNSA|nr:hypothetical protein DUNSADRAFT_3247 [Dunaliella salina]|eukprot:KAF5838198.1 hypothetical protein DUNSADRAFT_3247 [Dunaliella salina]
MQQRAPAAAAWGSSLQTLPPRRSEPAYGEVPGSQPNWHASNFADRGRKHLQGTAAEIGAGGLSKWNDPGNAPVERRQVRDGEYKAKVSSYAPAYSEPTIHGANQQYFSRRALGAEPDETYRRTTRHIPPPPIIERPGRKKLIPEPYGAPPQPSGLFTHPTNANKVPETYPEPGMPRSRRPPGATILRESDQELSYEHAFGRKVRVNSATYRGTGRAGDLSQSFAPTKRPEDTGSFFKSLKDSPTFTRFVSSLPPPPSVSPHQRRAQEMQRLQAAERNADRMLVSSLRLPEEDDEGS